MRNAHLLLFLGSLSALQAQQLDPAFNGGSVSLQPGNQTVVRAVVQHADLGCTWAGSVAGDQFDILVGRTLNDGAPDPAFGTSGVVFLNRATNSFEWGYDLIVLDDGRLIVGAMGLGTGTNEVILCRLLSDGTLDLTFGTQGYAVVAAQSDSPNDLKVAIALAPGGDIVAATIGFGGSQGRQVTLMRFSPDGVQDPLFGGDGVAELDFVPGQADDQFAGLHVNTDGTILIAGHHVYNTAPTTTDLAAARLLADGTLDATFGTGGVTLVDAGTNGDEDLTFGSTLLPNGDLLLLGEVRTNPNPRIAVVVRLDPDGQLVTSFANGGKLELDAGETPLSENTRCIRAVPRPGGGLWLLIHSANGSSNVVLAALDDNGSLDASFGTNGYFRFGMGVRPEDLVFTAEGRLFIVAAGAGINLPSALFLALPSGTTGIPSRSHAELAAYPNPCRDRLTVEAEVGGTWALHDTQGRTAASGRLQVGRNSLDLSSRPVGIYLLRMQLGAVQQVFRIVRE